MTKDQILTQFKTGTESQGEDIANDLLDTCNTCPDVSEFIGAMKTIGSDYTEKELRAAWASEYFDQVIAQAESLRDWFRLEAQGQVPNIYKALYIGPQS